MTVNLSIKEVPEAMAARLRARAERNHRSLQGELMAIIEKAAAEDLNRDLASAPIHTSQASAGKQSIEQFAALARLRMPKAVIGGPLAVDIIRKDRDSR
jgi:antitoxin FitA